MQIPPDRNDLPDHWYNIVPDLGFPTAPMMSPSGFPLGPHDLEAFVPQALIQQELDREHREIDIPRPLRDLYAEWRPTPMYRAERLERELDTPAHIYYKLEGGLVHSYEANTAVAQAYFASVDGTRRLVTATGNGSWGLALATATNLFKLDSTVYMVKSFYESKPHARYLLSILDTDVVASPSDRTETGRRELQRDPNSPGSLGLAVSAAFEDASAHNDTKFCWGTVMNHVLMHQTVIGLESRQQLRHAGARPDVVISAVGGGSAFGGLVFPFYRELRGKARFVAVETAAYPSLTKGRYSYDYGDSVGLAPMIKMYTVGSGYVPPKISAGGMRYHGMSPLVSALYRNKEIEAVAYRQADALSAAVQFARAEGVIPSPESAFTIKGLIDEATRCREQKERKNLLCIVHANSNIDVESFEQLVAGTLEEEEPFDQARSEAALNALPQVEPQAAS